LHHSAAFWRGPVADEFGDQLDLVTLAYEAQRLERPCTRRW
jgi:hypothetical protein